MAPTALSVLSRPAEGPEEGLCAPCLPLCAYPRVGVICSKTLSWCVCSHGCQGNPISAWTWESASKLLLPKAGPSRQEQTQIPPAKCHLQGQLFTVTKFPEVLGQVCWTVKQKSLSRRWLISPSLLGGDGDLFVKDQNNRAEFAFQIQLRWDPE